MNRRTIFIVDVHGCLEELQILLDRLRPTSLDRMIFLGDLVNKGPDSVGVVRLVCAQNWECVQGNHDAYFVKNSMARTDFREWKQQLGREAFQWLADRPLFLEEDRFIAVHAGLEPGVPPSATSPKILQNLRMWPLGSKEGRRPWHHYYSGSRWVFYGHWAGQGLHRNGRTLGLDSGCVYGRELSAFVLETETVVQVKARRVYEAVK